MYVFCKISDFLFIKYMNKCFDILPMWGAMKTPTPTEIQTPNNQISDRKVDQGL